MIMLSNLLKPSLASQSNLLNKSKPNQPNTIDTLSSLPATHCADLSLYFAQSSSTLELVQHSLDHGNLEWLEKQLVAVRNQASQCFYSRKVVESRQYLQHLDVLSEKTQQALQKVLSHRKTLHQTFLKNLLKSHKTNQKNLLRSNLSKYKSALLQLKSLKQKKIKSETEVTQLKSRLKTSGLYLVPSLIEKSLIRLAMDSMTGRERPVQITEIGNLGIVVDWFMGNLGILAERGMEKEKDAQAHQLYLKFKMYLLLKSCIQTNQQHLDQLCQAHISGFYRRNLNRVTETQHKKIKGLVQCDVNISKFLQSESTSHLTTMLQMLQTFTKNLQKTSPKILSQLLSKILPLNKKSPHLPKILIPSQCLTIISEELVGLVSIQEVKKIVDVVQDRRYLFQMYKGDLGMGGEMGGERGGIDEILGMVLMECLKGIVEVVLRICVETNRIVYKDKKQRHYHNTRIINRNILTWTQLNQLTSTKNNQILSHLHNLTQPQTTSPQKPQPSTTSISPNTSTTTSTFSLGQFLVQYNQLIGQTVLYIANKLSQLGHGDGKGRLEKNWMVFDVDRVCGMWVELICEGIRDDMLQQGQSVNILKNVKFMQNNIITHIDTLYKTQNQLQTLHQSLQPHQSKPPKKPPQLTPQQMEQTHMKILQLNLRARNYGKIMEICGIIKIQDEIRKMNQEIYWQVVKKIIG